MQAEIFCWNVAEIGALQLSPPPCQPCRKAASRYLRCPWLWRYCYDYHRFPWGSSSACGSRLKSLRTNQKTPWDNTQVERLFFCWIFFVVVWHVNSSSPPKMDQNGWLRLFFSVHLFCLVNSLENHLIFSGLFIVRRLNMGNQCTFCLLLITAGEKGSMSIILHLAIYPILRGGGLPHSDLSDNFYPKIFWWKSGPIWLQSICFLFNERGVGFETSNHSKTSRLRVLQMVIS